MQMQATPSSEASQVYGDWVSTRDKINAIDYAHAGEAYPGQRLDLVVEMNLAAARYRELTGNTPV